MIKAAATSDPTTGMNSSMPPAVIIGVSLDRKSTRLNSSHANISYAVFCLKKKTNPADAQTPQPNRVVKTFATSSFEALDSWKQTVVSGDRSALTALYSTSPPVKVKYSQE